MCSRIMGDYKKAIPYFKGIIPYWKHENYKPSKLSLAYMNLGVCYDELNQNDTSLYYHQKALDIDLELGNKYYQGKHHHNIGVVYEKLNQDKKALENFQLAKTLKEESGISESLGNTYHYLAKIYLKNGQYPSAQFYLKKHQEVALEVQSKEQLKGNYQLFSQYAKTVGDYKMAFDFQEKYHTLKDTLYELAKVKAINDIETKYKAKETEQQNQILNQNLALEKASSSKKSAYLFVAIFASLSAILIALLLYRRNKQKAQLNQILEKRIKQIEIVSRELQHRTNGQFTLTSYFIGEKKKQAERGEITTVLRDTENWFDSLSSINKHLSKNGKTSFRDSINEIADNLQFGAKTLIGKSLDLKIDIPSIFAKPNNKVYLGMLINELLTNSIKYAFEEEPHPEIALKVETFDDKAISFEYRDNGIGHKNHTSESGSGMIIISDIVEQLNGVLEVKNQDGFQFKASFPNFLK